MSREDAEDAMQETFLKIYTKADSFRGDENAIAAWVYKIVTRVAIDNEAKEVLVEMVDKEDIFTNPALRPHKSSLP